MNPPPSDSGWALQQLAGLLAAISSYDDEHQMLVGATHRIAEALDAEVCAIVTVDDRVPVAIGFPSDAVPEDRLAELADAGYGAISVPGLGDVAVQVVELGSGSRADVVIGRSDSALTAAELHLLRSMAQVVALALQLRRTADRERQLRERSEEQAERLRETNAAVVEAAAAKAALLSVASHELRTPLTSILGFTATLREHDASLPPASRIEFLHIVERHGQRLLRLIDDLLTVGQIESGRAAPRPTTVPVVDALRTLLSSTHRHIPVRGNAAAIALVDHDHLDQIVVNLLTNAEKYGAPPIHVEVAQHDTTVEVTVADQGRGVPEGFVPRLFDSFSQASTGEAREASGTGLGLSIVAGLARANGGDARYQRHDGETRFVVRLPSGVEDGDTPPAGHSAR